MNRRVVGFVAIAVFGTGLPVAFAQSVEAQSVDPQFVTEPEWSRDGGRIVLAGGPWPDLDVFIFNTESGEITRHFQSDSTDYMPSWAPDGRRIVFASTRANGTHDLFIGHLDSGSVTPLTADADCDNTESRWSPDGAWIAFRSDCDGNREVYRIRPDGTDRIRLTDSDTEDSEPSWSPDSRRLAFTSYRGGQPDVFVMNVDGTGLTRLTETPGGHSRRAEWSPDGEWISFGTNRDGNDEVYIMRADGSEPRNVSRHPAREYYSRWSPDGKTLAFTSNRNERPGSLYSMAVDGSEVVLLYPRSN